MERAENRRDSQEQQVGRPAGRVRDSQQVARQMEEEYGHGQVGRTQCGGWEWKDGQMGETPVWGMGRWVGPQPGGVMSMSRTSACGGHTGFPPNADHRCPVSWPMKASRAKVHLCCFRLLICF